MINKDKQLRDASISISISTSSNKQSIFLNKVKKIVDTHGKNFDKYIESSGDLSFINQVALSIIINKVLNNVIDDDNSSLDFNKLLLNNESNPVYYIEGFEETDGDIFVLYEYFKKDSNSNILYHTRTYFWTLISHSDRLIYNKIRSSVICLGSVYKQNEFEDKTKNLVFNIFNFRPQLTYIKIKC